MANGGSGDAMAGKVAELVPTRSDADVAADLKRRLEDALKPVMAVMDEATRAGLTVNFTVEFQGPPMMRNVASVKVSKHLA